jgi:hypothetical protein
MHYGISLSRFDTITATYRFKVWEGANEISFIDSNNDPIVRLPTYNVYIGFL